MYKKDKNDYKYLFILFILIVTIFIIFIVFNKKETTLYIRDNKVSLTYNYDGKLHSVNGQLIEADNNTHIFVPSFYNLDNIVIDAYEGGYEITRGYYYKDVFSKDVINENQISKAIQIKNNNREIILHPLENETLSIDLKGGYTLDDIKADKELKAKANITNIDNYGKILFDGELEYIKGRGNSSWVADKKAYLITLKNNGNIMNIGDYKHYCLIPSSNDMTGIRNKLVFNYSKEIDLENTNTVEYINLFIDGKYEGLYLITQHISKNVSKAKIDTSNKSILIVNENIGDLNEIKYFDNKNDSKSTTYIIEKDDSRYYEVDKESAGFVTKRNDCYRIRNSKGMTYDEVLMIASKIQELENAIFNESNDDFMNMIDLDSWIKRYIIEELFQNSDTDITSFFYTIKRTDMDKIYAGPIWDYDNTMGEGRTQCQEPKTLNLTYLDGGHIISKLSTRKCFMNKVIDKYINELYPKIDKLIYTDTVILSNKVKSDMYLSLLRYNQTDFIVTNNKYYQYDYQYAINMLQGNLYEHSRYMFDVYKQYFNYVRLIFKTKNYIMHDICFLVKKGSSLLEEREVPYYSSGNGFVWNEPLWISKWVDKEGNEFDFTKPIIEDTEIYAVWEGDTDASILQK